MTNNFDDLVIEAMARNTHRLFLALNEALAEEVSAIMKVQGRAILTELFEERMSREESALKTEQIKRVAMKTAEEIVLAGMKKLTERGA